MFVLDTLEEACSLSCISFLFGWVTGSKEPHQLARPPVILVVSVPRLPKADLNPADS
jgi:hypothetical protein